MTELLAIALEFAMYALYENMVEQVEGLWMDAAGSFNNGQQIIFFNNIGGAVWDWLSEAGQDWPYADVGYYVESLYSCYDEEVMDRAFSEVINAPVGQMEAMVQTGIQLDLAIQLLYAL